MSTYDYIIAGGGLSGCVVASRLKEAFPDRSVVLIETGEDSRNDTAIASPGNAWMIGPEKYHNFSTAPQKNANDRNFALKTGKLLGGGSAVNYGGWTRGDRDGYDEWAKQVGDPRWSYNSLLPYFKKAETWHAPGKEEQHGYSGPIKPTRGNRGYLLKEPVKRAMLDAGFEENEDGNGGDFLGMVPLVEGWNNNKRTFAANEYDLSGVEILTSKQIHKIAIADGKATGVLLTDGTVMTATREVILSCGALFTPQVLMLSGIGPKAELAKHNIPLLIDRPGIGQNLHDHPMVSFWYKLQHPEQGLALGHQNFMSNPKYLEGNPMDWMVNATAPRNAPGIDGTRRDDIELVCIYLPSPTSAYAPPPMDGTVISLGAVGMSITSRGSVTLASTDPKDLPVVDPAYLATAHDRAVMREAIRMTLKIADTSAWKEICHDEELPHGDLPLLNVKSTDEEIDARVRAVAVTCYHYAGTAAMGDVVDTDCRVKGVERLRIIDASILPLSIAAHLQAVMYGVAERGAQMIIDDNI